MPTFKNYSLSGFAYLRCKYSEPNEKFPIDVGTLCSPCNVKHYLTLICRNLRIWICRWGCRKFTPTGEWTWDSFDFNKCSAIEHFTGRRRWSLYRPKGSAVVFMTNPITLCSTCIAVFLSCLSVWTIWFFFKKMGHPRPLLSFFRSFQTNITIFTTIYVKKCPFSIRYRDSNPRPLGRESPPTIWLLFVAFRWRAQRLGYSVPPIWRDDNVACLTAQFRSPVRYNDDYETYSTEKEGV